MNYGDITNSWFYIPDIVNWTPIILGAVFGSLLLICPIILCCICCCCYKKQKNKQRKNAPPPKGPAYPPAPSPSFQPTPTRQIGVKPPPDPPKPVKVQPPPPKKEPAKVDKKADPLVDQTKDIFAKEQGHWAEVWKNANDPSYREPPSKSKAKYGV